MRRDGGRKEDPHPRCLVGPALTAAEHPHAGKKIQGGWHTRKPPRGGWGVGLEASRQPSAHPFRGQKGVGSLRRAANIRAGKPR